MDLPLGKLLSLTFQYARRHISQFVLGILVFTVLFLLLQIGAFQVLLSIGKHFLGSVNTGTDSLPGQIGSISGGVADAALAVQPNYAIQFLMLLLHPSLSALVGIILSFLLLYGVYVLLMSVLFTMAGAYFMLIVFDSKRGTGTMFLRSLALVPSFIGLSAWISIRSLVWLPYIFLVGFALLGIVVHSLLSYLGIALFVTQIAAFILTLWFFPRLFFAVPIMINERAGIRGSTKLSYERTAGFWGKIVGNLIVWSIVSAAIFAALQFIFIFLVKTVAPFLGGIPALIAAALYLGPELVIVFFLLGLSQIFVGLLSLAVAAPPAPAAV